MWKRSKSHILQAAKWKERHTEIEVTGGKKNTNIKRILDPFEQMTYPYNTPDSLIQRHLVFHRFLISIIKMHQPKIHPIPSSRCIWLAELVHAVCPKIVATTIPDKTPGWKDDPGYSPVLLTSLHLLQFHAILQLTLYYTDLHHLTPLWSPDCSEN